MSSSGQYVTYMGNPAIFMTSKTYGYSYWIGIRFENDLYGDYVALDMSNNGMYQYLATNNGTFVYLNMTKFTSSNDYEWLGYTITAPVPFPAKVVSRHVQRRRLSCVRCSQQLADCGRAVGVLLHQLFAF
jgi:hypothetical protein